MAAEARRSEAFDQDRSVVAESLPSSAEAPRDVPSPRYRSATSLEVMRARKVEAEVLLVEEQVIRIRLESERLAGEIARQPLEARALELGNEETEVRILVRLAALLLPLIVTAVALIVLALDGTAARHEFASEVLNWVRLVGR